MLLAVVALALAACGGGSSKPAASTASSTSASAPAATTSPPASTEAAATYPPCGTTVGLPTATVVHGVDATGVLDLRCITGSSIATDHTGGSAVTCGADPVTGTQPRPWVYYWSSQNPRTPAPSGGSAPCGTSAWTGY